MINNTSKLSPKNVLLALALGLFSTAGYSADIVQQSITNSAVSNTPTASQTLPNAYELVKKIDSQKLEIARLSGQIEKLELDLNEIKQFIDSDLKNLINSEVSSALAAQARSTATTSSQPPYLAPSNSNENRQALVSYK